MRKVNTRDNKIYFEQTFISIRPEFIKREWTNYKLCGGTVSRANSCMIHDVLAGAHTKFMNSSSFRIWNALLAYESFHGITLININWSTHHRNQLFQTNPYRFQQSSLQSKSIGRWIESEKLARCFNLPLSWSLVSWSSKAAKISRNDDVGIYPLPEGKNEKSFFMIYWLWTFICSGGCWWIASLF